jgi:hypothetical protein
MPVPNAQAAMAIGIAMSFVARHASAKDPPRPVTTPAAAPEVSTAPDAHRGFQAALRAGVSLPFGSVTSTTAMSDAVSIQVPIIVDLGVKPSDRLFIGAYFGVAQGSSSPER